MEYDSGSDEDDGDLRASIDSKVHIDAWQNQRFKPLQGGWCMPFDGGVPYFSDLSGARKIGYETDEDDGEVVPEVRLKEGWRFLDEWEIDMSGAYGEVDVEGWSYATSFENLFEQSAKRTSQGEMGRLSLVRRRRWVRVKECSDFQTKVGFKELMSWNDQLGLRLGQILAEKEAEFNMYVEHYSTRMEQAEVTIKYSMDGMDETISVLSHIVRKLKYVKEFLEERGEIEAQHAAALESFAEKWKDKGGKPEELIRKKGEEEQEEEQDFGFFTCVCTADALASSRMTSFSFMLSESLPQDVDSVLEEAQSILHDCLSDEISPQINMAESEAKANFSAYKTAMHAVRVASVAERGRLQSTLLSESAADGSGKEASEDGNGGGGGGDDRARASSRMSAGVSARDSLESTSTAGGAAGMTSYAGTVQKADVFVALRDYRLAVLKADSLVTKFSAFVKQQRKSTRLLGIRIQALLQAMVKMFSHEFKRLYEDTSADLSRFLGSVEQAQQLQKRLSQQGESVAGSGWGRQSRNVERSPSGIRYHGEEKEEVLELSNPQFPLIPASAVIARKGVLKIAVTRNAGETPPTPPVERTRTISFSPADIMQSASAAAGVTVTPTRTKSNSMTPASASASSSGQPPSSSGVSASMGVVGPCEWSPVLPGADSKDCSWLYVMVIVTYDASMLVFQPTETKAAITEEVFRYGEPWLRLGLAGASVQPLLLQDGDAFSVRTKYVPCALMVDEGEGPQQVVEWMRVCLNPVADPEKEPPIDGGGGAHPAAL